MALLNPDNVANIVKAKHSTKAAVRPVADAEESKNKTKQKHWVCCSN